MKSEEEESDDVHTCGKCKKVFMDLTLFLQHKRNHKAGAALTASKLSSPFYQIKFTDTEERAELDSRLMNSPIVDSPTNSGSTELGEHSETVRKIEVKDETHQCPHCSQLYANKGSLLKHLAKSHLTGVVSDESEYSTVRTIFSCSICKTSFQSKIDMEKHEKSHDKAEGLPCGDTECTGILFRINISQLIEETGHPESHSVPPAFKCLQCSRTFMESRHIYPHMTNPQEISENEDDAINSSGLIDNSELSNPGQQVAQGVVGGNIGDHAKPFRCNFPKCTFTFRTKGSLVRHERRHTDSRPFKCVQCSRTFRESGALTRHKRSQIPCTQKRDSDFPMYGRKKPLPGQAVIPSDGFDEPIQSDLMCGSLLSIRGNKVQALNIVVENSEIASEIKNLEEETEGGYSIMEVPRTEASNTELEGQEEEAADRGESEILASSDGSSGDGGDIVRVPDYFGYCQLCKEKVEPESVLKVHIKEHLSQGVFLCEQCPHIAPNINELTAHTTHTHAVPNVWEGSEYMGSERVYEYDASRIEQLRTINPQQGVREAILAVQQLLILENASPDSTITEVKDQILTLRYIRKCPVCDRLCRTAAHLKQHVRMHTGERPYKCKHCPKDFPTKDTFKKHLFCHTNERSYRCGECGKLFKRISHAKEHLKTHSNHRPYQCQICLKSFKTFTIFKVHERSHSGHFPWVCKVCDKKFREKASLTRHIRTHTGEKPFECVYCGKRFSEHGTLSRHIRAKLPCSVKLSAARNHDAHDQVTVVDEQTYSTPTEVDLAYGTPSVIDGDVYPAASALVQFSTVAEDGQGNSSPHDQCTGGGEIQPSFSEDAGSELKTLQMAEDSDAATATYFMVDGQLVTALPPGACSADTQQEGVVTKEAVKEEELYTAVQTTSVQPSQIIFITDDFIV